LCAPSVVDTYFGATSAGTTNASNRGEKPNAAPYAATAGAGVRGRRGEPDERAQRRRGRGREEAERERRAPKAVEGEAALRVA
jgi:hypothetical protein